MSFITAGINVYEDKNGRHIVFAEELTADTFDAFLREMMRDRLEFSLYDPKYPSSPEDPGAYLSYSPQNGRWEMTLGNHGWSGGIYDIDASIVAKQLFSLYSAKKLQPLGLDQVCFFSHYKPEPEAQNAEMNALLRSIHDMTFNPELRKRAADFLSRAIPSELLPLYFSGSLADIIITHCAQARPIDPELCEIAKISVIEYDHAIAKAQTAELKAYYTECQQLLREIINVSR